VQDDIVDIPHVAFAGDITRCVAQSSSMHIKLGMWLFEDYHVVTVYWWLFNGSGFYSEFPLLGVSVLCGVSECAIPSPSGIVYLLFGNLPAPLE